MNRDKTEKKTGRKADPLLLLIGVLCVLALGVAVYGIGFSRRPQSGEQAAADEEEGASGTGEEDPLALRSVVVGDTKGETEAVEEDGETMYYIKVTMPADFPFEKTTLGLELADGAAVSDKSNCILNDLGGRLIVNLTVEDAGVIIENGGKSREYRFRIDLE